MGNIIPYRERPVKRAHFALASEDLLDINLGGP
jgi:hypothetical protein